MSEQPPVGWTGIMSQLLHYLRIVGADTDEEGKFLIRGEVVTFMGMSGDGAETVVGPKAVYFIDGHPYNLAHGLGTTSYGTNVMVII